MELLLFSCRLLVVTLALKVAAARTVSVLLLFVPRNVFPCELNVLPALMLTGALARTGAVKVAVAGIVKV